MALRFTRRRASFEIGTLTGMILMLVCLLLCVALELWGSLLLQQLEVNFGFQFSPLNRYRIGLWLWSSRFNLMTTLLLVVAMILSERRFPWWVWVVASIAFLALPSASIYFNRLVEAAMHRAGVTDGWYVGLAAGFALNLIVALGMGWFLRSWLVLAAFFVAALVPATARLWLILYMPILPGTNGGRSAPEWQFVINPLFQSVIAFGLACWSLRQRRANAPVGLCRWCGYDLRGSPSAECPECGNKAAAIPA